MKIVSIKSKLFQGFQYSMRIIALLTKLKDCGYNTNKVCSTSFITQNLYVNVYSFVLMNRNGFKLVVKNLPPDICNLLSPFRVLDCDQKLMSRPSLVVFSCERGERLVLQGDGLNYVIVDICNCQQLVFTILSFTAAGMKS